MSANESLVLALSIFGSVFLAGAIFGAFSILKLRRIYGRMKNTSASFDDDATNVFSAYYCGASMEEQNLIERLSDSAVLDMHDESLRALIKGPKNMEHYASLLAKNTMLQIEIACRLGSRLA